MVCCEDVVLEPQPKFTLPEFHGQVLVVDDDQAQVDLLTYSLRRQGYSAIKAITGTAAMEMAHQQLPDLILLDIGLPDVSGLEVCEKLTDDAKTCHIPVILLTGMDTQDILRRSRSAGCHYFVQKPYDPNALLLLVEHAIKEC